MFSSFPKILDRNFVFGFLLPVLVALVSLLFVLRDMAPFSALYRDTLDQTKADSLTLVALVVAVSTVLLTLINIPLYRFLEGYIGPLKSEGEREWYRQQLLDSRKKIDDEEDTIRMRERNPKVDKIDDNRHYQDWRKLYERFPRDERLVLPTRLGNAIRAFESYPVWVYGIDSISAWFRLQAVLPKPVLASVDDSRAKVDLCVNVWLLALIVAAVAAAHCLFAAMSWSEAPRFRFSNASIAVIALVTAAAAYELAIMLVSEWGGFVKAAFDLHLPELARQLGYQLPKASERKAFWNDVNSQFNYWSPIDSAQWPAAELKAAKPAGGGDPAQGEAGDSDGGND
jgi:hypothetical protein